MLEQRKEKQCQIRLTDRQYRYLQDAKSDKRCSVSAYFRSLLEQDMKTPQAKKKVEMANDG